MLQTSSSYRLQVADKRCVLLSSYSSKLAACCLCACRGRAAANMPTLPCNWCCSISKTKQHNPTKCGLNQREGKQAYQTGTEELLARPVTCLVMSMPWMEWTNNEPALSAGDSSTVPSSTVLHMLQCRKWAPIKMSQSSCPVTQFLPQSGRCIRLCTCIGQAQAARSNMQLPCRVRLISKSHHV